MYCCMGGLASHSRWQSWEVECLRLRILKGGMLIARKYRVLALVSKHKKEEINV